MSTLTEFKEALNKIGFDIKGRYPNSWVYNVSEMKILLVMMLVFILKIVM